MLNTGHKAFYLVSFWYTLLFYLTYVIIYPTIGYIYSLERIEEPAVLDSTIAGVAAGASVLGIVAGLVLLHKFDQVILQRRAAALSRSAQKVTMADADDIVREEAVLPKLMALLEEKELIWVQWSLVTMLEHGELPSYITAAFLEEGCRVSDVVARINMERDRRPNGLAQRFQQQSAPQYSAA